MKHIIALLCALILILSVSAVIGAADEVYTEGTLYYTIGDETINIVGCFGRKTEVTVPSSIAGYPVNTIASGAFATNQYIKKLNLPDTITTIENGAIAEGIKVIYNANTAHPQEEVPDIITGREPILVPTDPESTKPTKSPDQKATSAETQAAKSDGRQTPTAADNSGGDRIIEGDVDLTDEEASEASSPTASDSSEKSDAAEDGSTDPSARSEKKAGQPSDAVGAATSDESGSGSNGMIILTVIISAVVIAAAGFAYSAVRKKKNSGK